MQDSAAQLLKKIRTLQDRFEQDLSERRKQFAYRVENGKVRFEAQARRRNKALKVGLGRFLAQTRPLVVLTAPVIYAMILPFVLLDVFVSLYQRICFPVYGIPRVNRRDYIKLDRHQLSYLNGLQKLNCLYCGYCNGLIAYVGEIAGRTEAYWCPIKHAMRVAGRHRHYPEFLDYGDGEGWVQGVQRSRDRLKGL